MTGPGPFDQNLPHRSCGNGKEMGTILPLQLPVTQQPQIGFMNQCCGLQGLPVAFPPHVFSGELAQFLVYNGKQFGKGLLLTCSGSFQQAGYDLG
jgi:hypothetical protein